MTETRLKGNKLSSGYSGNKNNIRSLYYNDNKILTRIIQAEKDIESLKEQTEFILKKLSTLVELTKTHTNQIKTLDSTTKTNIKDINNLENSLKSLINKLNTTNNSINALSRRLSTNVSTINNSINTLQNRVNSIKSCTCSKDSTTTKSRDIARIVIPYNTDKSQDMSLRSENSSSNKLDDNITVCDLDEITNGGELENMDNDQKLDYIIVALDALTMASESILTEVTSHTTSINNINSNLEIMSKSINEMNTSLIDIKNKINNSGDSKPDKPSEPDKPIDPDKPKPEPEPKPEEENVSITAKNNIIKTRAGKAISYYISAQGLQSGNIKIYVNGELSHSLTNVENNKEFVAYSEVIFEEMDNHMVSISIESEKGTKSNSVQFTVNVISVFDTEELVLSTNSTTLFCPQHTELGFPVIITGSLDGYCNLYVNGKYAGFVQGFENGKEFIIYTEKVSASRDYILQIEYPEGNRSNELIFTVVVDNYISPDEENKFYIYSEESAISCRSGETVSYVAAIRGLQTKSFKVIINGSYYKTYNVNSETNLERFVLYQEDVTVDRVLYIQIEDEAGNCTNTITYEVTIINNDTTTPEGPTTRDLVINWTDLERYVNLYDKVICKANISGLETDCCNVYVNGSFNRRLTSLTDLKSVVLFDFIAEDDIELNIQIEDDNKIKSNTLKYCIHLKENIVEPGPSEEEVLPGLDSTCVPYSKLIGGNRSTWTKGNQELISDISKLSINCLTLSVRMLIPNHISTTVEIDSEDLAKVKAFMLTMRAQGLLNKIQIILEPCPCINKGEVNEREFSPTDKKSFIINWRNEVIKLLNEFKDYFFWGIYVNTNMDILYDQPLLWQEIYDVIKEGRPESNVMIKTNWWETEDDEAMMGFNTKCTADYFKIWDVISISAYFPLSKDAKSASYSDIFTWINYGNNFNNRIIKNDMRTLALTLDKPLMLGELGLPAVDYAVTEPSNENVGSIVDETTQKNWYMAWHNTFINEDWFLGWSFYHMADEYNSLYDPSERSTGLYIASLDCQNKFRI